MAGSPDKRLMSSKITFNLLKLQYKIEISHFNMQFRQFFMRMKTLVGAWEESGVRWSQLGVGCNYYTDRQQLAKPQKGKYISVCVCVCSGRREDDSKSEP